MAITSQMVKDLRTSTGAGMMDCKKALDETNGDMEAAIDWLRKKGLAAAAKKASRVASEGLVAVKTAGAVGAVIEVNSETDFVSRNEEFQGFVRSLADIGTNCDSIDALMDMPYTGTSHSVADELTNKIAKIGENMSIRRIAKLSVDQGVVVSYIHNAVADGMGKIGVLVGLESAADASVLEQLGRQIAMHIAATAPASLSEADLDPEYVARERKLLVDQAIQSGKPADIAEKMVEGRMKKFMKEVVLLEQIFVIDGETVVSKVIENAAKDAGTPITLTSFIRFNLGEGIEKEETDFAAEVAAQLES
ncbi:MAG: translation elongation factor Ts [Pseudomonadota bacterium]|nr:translation elongation factor Ts [Pseudomonadota bacterium]